MRKASGPQKCRGCNREIKWGHKDGRPHPFDIETGDSHFSTCPKAATFRRNGGDALGKVTLETVSKAVLNLKSKGFLVDALYPMSIQQILDLAAAKQENLDG